MAKKQKVEKPALSPEDINIAEGLLQETLNLLTIADSQQWVIKRNGQIIQGYRGKEIFSSEAKARKSFENSILWGYGLTADIGAIKNIANNFYKHDYFNPIKDEIMELMIERGFVTFERIR